MIIFREAFLKYAFEVKKMMLVILVNMVLMSSPLLKISSLWWSGLVVVGAGLDKLNQDERTRRFGARAFIPASGNGSQRCLKPVSPVFALVCCAHVPESGYIGTGQFPSPGGSGGTRRHPLAYSWSPGSCSRPQTHRCCRC